MSRRLTQALAAAALAVVTLTMASKPACAQYPGSPGRKPVDTSEPKLRSTAVLEWIGEPGKPSASRIVPIAVWDGERYQAGGLYLAQPEPLAVMDETEYELEQAGVPQGRFVIFHPGQVNHNWFGYGVWRPLALKKVAKLTPSKTPPKVVTEVGSEKKSVTPVSGTQTPGTQTPGTQASGAQAPGTERTADKSTNAPSTTTSKAPDASGPDPDRPTLRKRAPGDAPPTETSSAPAGSSDAKSGSGSDDVDGDRPTLRKRYDKAAAAIKAANSTERDPDRPNLHRGAPTAGDPALQASKLTGMPADLQQMAAISDATAAPDHPFLFQWANAEDAIKMKVALEGIARKALAASIKPGTIETATVTNSPRRAPKPAPARKTTRGASQPALLDEKFNAYELSYSGGATLILTASSGTGEGLRYVTVIAQPDFYGVPHVLLQSVSIAAHLDMTPRMRFIDVADTDSDNRGELIFELRGETDRQFAIYKVARGQAEQVFLSEPLPFETTRN